MAAKKFMVVESKDSNNEAEVSVIPEVWIVNGKCFWPPSSEYMTKLRKCVVPLESWVKCDFVCLKSGFSKYLLTHFLKNVAIIWNLY